MYILCRVVLNDVFGDVLQYAKFTFRYMKKYEDELHMILRGHFKVFHICYKAQKARKSYITIYVHKSLGRKQTYAN